MEQISTGGTAPKTPFHKHAATATVADVMRPPLTTAGQYDHVAAAAYLMKRAGNDSPRGRQCANRPAGIITQANVARAIAAGKDLDDARVHTVMITRPVLDTTTSILDAARIMTARRLRHLPITGDSGLLGVIGITDVCRALTGAGQG